MGIWRCFGIDTLRPKYVDSSFILYLDITTFYHRKLCMKTWHSSKSLLILLMFLVSLFGIKMSWYLHTHILLRYLEVGTLNSKYLIYLGITTSSKCHFFRNHKARKICNCCKKSVMYLIKIRKSKILWKRPNTVRFF